MNYSNQAKRFVNGLRDTIKGTPHEPPWDGDSFSVDL